MKQALPVREVIRAAEEVAAHYPASWGEWCRESIPRVAEELSWIIVPGGAVVDLGGSSGFHAAVSARLGMRAVCVDNQLVRGEGTNLDGFADEAAAGEAAARGLGVEFIDTDLLNWEMPFPPDSIDAFMSFDVMEHLHHSPRTLFRQLVRCLMPGGRFLLGTPNAANLLKRVRLLAGTNIFAEFEHWYMYPQFIGHVREPTVRDFRRLAADLGLEINGMTGRNWAGYLGGRGNSRLVRALTTVADRPLRLFPSLCSDIYLMAQKPGAVVGSTPAAAPSHSPPRSP